MFGFRWMVDKVDMQIEGAIWTFYLHPDKVSLRVNTQIRVTGVRENHGESGNFKVPFSNEGISGKMDFFGENQGKILGPLL